MRTLAVVLAHYRHAEASPLYLMQYSFLDEYEDIDFAIKLSLQDINGDELFDRLRRTRKQLYQRCMGLAEAYKPPQSTNGFTYPPRFLQNLQTKHTSPFTEEVGFVHRSVYDFLSQSKIKRIIADNCAGFDDSDFHFQAFITTFKMFKPNQEYFSFH